MSGTLLRGLIAGVLAFHGVGHAMGVIAALEVIKVRESSQAWLKNWSSRSWLLTKLLGQPISRILCLILYLSALLGFIAAALALLGWGVPHDWWRTLSIVSAAISLCSVLVFWNGLMLLFPHKVGALGVSIATLVCLLVLSWPAEASLGF